MKRSALFSVLAASSLLSGCVYQNVRVMSDPPQADIVVDGVPRGKEPVDARLSVDSFMNILGKNHEIVAKLDGYEDAILKLVSSSFMFSDASPFPNAVTLKLKPAAGTTAPSAAAETKPRFPTSPAVSDFPKAKARPDDVAVVIGNADYSKQGKDIPNVVPAYADAAGFKLYAEDALGVPSGNVIFLKDATGSQLQRVFGTETNYKGQLFDWVKPGSRVFVYYAGHGAPSTQNGDAYLVPVDADAGRVELSGYALKTLYSNLDKLPAESVTVVLEACFSGNSQDGGLIAKASPLITKVKAPAVPSKLSVFTAGSAGQIASWEEGKTHGLFSEYFLKGAAGEADKAPYGNEDGRVDPPELARYVKDKVPYAARRAYGRDQNPEYRAGN